MRTVRARITLLATIVAAVVLVGSAVGLVYVLDSQVTAQSDGALQARVTELGAQALAGTLDDVPRPVTDDGLVQVLDGDGKVLAASPNLAGAGAVAEPSRGTGQFTVATLTAPDDAETERYRVWLRGFLTPQGPVTVLVGVSLESADEATAALRHALYVGVPLLLLLQAVGTWWVVGRALGRVERVRREVASLGDADLARRLEPGPPDEVGLLVSTLNAMLGRLDEGQRRQRDFVADASHELQSPVAAFRTQLEVARAHPEGVDWIALVDDLVDDTDRMQALVSDLLLLAVSGSTAPDRHPLDLRELVESELARLAGTDLALDVVPGPAVAVSGDPDRLARAVGNLLDNAARHAARRVTVEVGSAGGSAWVRVTDDGEGVPGEHLDRVFDRFHRVEQSRSRTRRGTGLGLAIARSVARAHGGELVLLGPGPGAVFELRLPSG